ncbi:MAG: LicD family protein [Oscillospiraceae bacterium]|nr:LicD family protein [Oscillospiraceae bacterium]
MNRLLQELKRVELDILARFIQVCQQLDLRYYILQGTLLGAVRHQGFIPWDDDIDVGMPRADYEIFLREGQKLLGEPYFVQTFLTDPPFTANFAKIRNSNTTFVETSLRGRVMNHGVYMDIFPLDFYPDDPRTEKNLRRKNWFLNGRITATFYFSEKLPLKSRVKHIACTILHPSVEKALQARDALFRSVTAGSRIANHCSPWRSREIVPAEWYGEGCELEFEGLKVRAPKEYDKWLTQVYGDYMQLPPPEKRKGHHYYDVIDLEKPYTEYIK